jgi:hypothetical protein
MGAAGALRRHAARGLIPLLAAWSPARAQDELDARAATFTAGLDDAVYATTTGPEAAHELFHEVDLSPYQLLSASLQFDRQKLVFTPGRLAERYVPVLSETRFNVSQAYGIVTVGAGTSYTNAAPEGGRALAIARDVLEDAPARDAGEELEAYVERVGPLVVERFHERLAANAVLLTAAVNAQLFEVIGGTAVDEDGDGLDDHAHRLRSWDVGGAVTWGITARAGLDAAYHYQRKRATAEAGAPLVPHHGASISTTVRVATLDRDYRAYDAYQRALFLPSIVVGMGAEFLRCRGDAERCEDAVRDRWVFTPFLDFRLAQTNQLRVGMPIERREEFGGGSEVELKPIFQVTIQLASP